MGRTIPGMGTDFTPETSTSGEFLRHKSLAIRILQINRYVWHPNCYTLGSFTLEAIEKKVMRNKSKRKLVVLITANEKISSLRNSSKPGRTVKTLVQALRCGVPVTFRTGVN